MSWVAEGLAAYSRNAMRQHYAHLRLSHPSSSHSLGFSVPFFPSSLYERAELNPSPSGAKRPESRRRGGNGFGGLRCLSGLSAALCASIQPQLPSQANPIAALCGEGNALRQAPMRRPAIPTSTSSSSSPPSQYGLGGQGSLPPPTPRTESFTQSGHGQVDCGVPGLRWEGGEMRN